MIGSRRVLAEASSVLRKIRGCGDGKKLLARLAASLTLQIRMFMHRVLRDVDAICMRRASHSMAWPGVGSWRPVVTRQNKKSAAAATVLVEKLKCGEGI
jgi:hypothetical protein